MILVMYVGWLFYERYGHGMARHGRISEAWGELFPFYILFCEPSVNDIKGRCIYYDGHKPVNFDLFALSEG